MALLGQRLMPGQAEHYCFHCLTWAELLDGVYCAACLNFFYIHNRLPKRGDQ
jgi:hypothetical protein